MTQSDSLCPGSKSDGQRSPNDAVFLRMDDIPFIHEDRPESCGEDGEPFEIFALYACLVHAIKFHPEPFHSRRACRLRAIHLSLHQLSVSGWHRGQPRKEAAAQTK